MTIKAISNEEAVDRLYPYSTRSTKEAIVKIFNYLGIYGEESINNFLNPSLKLFNHPFAMKDLEAAVDLLIKYLDDNKKILFFGDYDCDGITTTALFVKTLKELGYTNIDWFIPDRQLDGYGLNEKRMEKFVKEYDLIVTGDTGIKEVNVLKETPIPVILTDHHEPIITSDKEEIMKYKDIANIISKNGLYMAIPKAAAVVNPKRIDCDYKNKCLSGVAVIYKLLQGLFIKKKYDQMLLVNKLDLVALGLVADVVPQIDKDSQDLEVRMMTAAGLNIMNNNPDYWVQAIMSVNDKKSVTFSDLGFLFGPRINAPGRLGKADKAVEFLLAEDPEEIFELAQELQGINDERKTIQEQAIKSVEEQLSSGSLIGLTRLIVTKLDKEFDSGITGLVASNLVNKYQVPVIVFCEKIVDGETLLTGSCRSIEGVSILDILIDVEKKLGPYKYGGHVGAAGLTINESQFGNFKKISQNAANALDAKLFENAMHYDIELPLKDLTLDVVKLIEQTFHTFRLLSKDNEMYSPPSIFKTKHGELFINGDKLRHRLVIWNRGQELIENYLRAKKEKADIVYTCSTWNGRISLTLENWKFI